MTIDQIYIAIVRPTLRNMGEQFCAASAQVQVLADGYQETKFLTRVQYDNGPARSYWQFEKGGILALMNNPKTDTYLHTACLQYEVHFDVDSVYAALETNDGLGCVCGRLILWADNNPLPALGDELGAQKLYLRTERPGRFRPHDWHDSYTRALDTFRENN